MHLMRLSAPVDVAETLNWLGEAGWRARAASGGPPHWPGNASLAVEFAKDGDQVSVARDRGQWMLDIYPDGWGRALTWRSCMPPSRAVRFGLSPGLKRRWSSCHQESRGGSGCRVP